MTSRTLHNVRERWLSAAAGAGIALGVLVLLFGAASLSRAAPLAQDQLTPAMPGSTGDASTSSSSAPSSVSGANTATSTGSAISGKYIAPTTNQNSASDTSTTTLGSSTTQNGFGTATGTSSMASSSPTTNTLTPPMSSTAESSSTQSQNTQPTPNGTLTQNAPLMRAAPPSAPVPMVTTITSTGHALIRGVVRSVGANSLTLATWGGSWTVNITDMTHFIGTANSANGSSANALSGITVGDFVGVSGVVAPNEIMTVNAADLRDWTQFPPTARANSGAAPNGNAGNTAAANGTSNYYNGSAPSNGSTSPSGLTPSASSSENTEPAANLGAQTSSNLGTSTASQGGVASSSATVSTPGSGSSTNSYALPAGERLFTGTVSNVTETGFTLTTGSGKTYTVSVSPSSTIWNSKRNTTPLTSFQSGDQARIDGSLSGSSGITASVVRDTAR